LAVARRGREGPRRGVAGEHEEAHGAAPTIVYFDLMMLLDNEAGTITEWSQTGEEHLVSMS